MISKACTEMEINVRVSAVQFTPFKMSISNNVWESLDQRISSALLSTMFTNGMIESISVSIRITASSLRKQRSVSRTLKKM